MNKSDIKLIIGILFIIATFLLFTNHVNNNGPKRAIVYYNNKELISIDLKDEVLKEYKVKGYNGDVILQTLSGKIRVSEETSPLHICSYQGWIDSPHEVIVCLPNKIVVKIEDNNREIDTVVR